MTLLTRSYQAGTDVCLGFWKECYGAGWMDFPPEAQVLELGCAEADWQSPMLALRPDLHITGIDVRPCSRPGLTIQGDILEQRFAPASFDAIVAVSHLEWVGIGHYADPVVENADRRELALCASWLKPGGWLYFDVPHRPRTDRTRKFRAYTDEMLAAVISPEFREVRRQTFSGAACLNHQDGPYIALLLEHA